MLTITTKDLRNAAKENAELLWKIIEALCERVRQLSTETLDLSFRDVPYRILRVLSRASARHGQATDNGMIVNLDATNLASQVNCGVDQARRTLQKLEERKLIKVEDRHVLVPDPGALSRALEYED